jgi:hypothetical protein
MGGRTAVAVVWLLATAGCGNNDQSTRPVSWYLEHTREMQAKVAWCVDAAERQRSPDCSNAIEAKRRTLLGSQKSLAPIDWGASQAKP